VSYSHRYVQWETARRNAAARKSIWEGFALSETDGLCRSKELVKELVAAKNADEGIVVSSANGHSW